MSEEYSGTGPLMADYDSFLPPEDNDITDRQLSAEKLSILLDKLHRLNYDSATIQRIESDMDIGQLDAECPKCGDSGVSRILEFLEDGTATAERCNCPAGRGEK